MSFVYKTYVEDFPSNILVDLVENNLKDGHDDKLNNIGLTQHCTHGDEDGGCTEVGTYQPASTGITGMYNQKGRKGTNKFCSEADHNLS